MPLPKLPTRPAVFLSAQAVEETNKAPRVKPRATAVVEPIAGDASTRESRPRDEASARSLPTPQQPRSASDAPEAASRSVVTMFEPRPRAKAQGDAVKLFILDTNVLMHDPSALFRFEEHDVYPADDDARGTRRSQEGHVGSRAQRAAGQPLARRAGRHAVVDARRRRHRERHRAVEARQQGRRRQAVLPDARGDAVAAVGAADRQGRQPDPRRRPRDAGGASVAAGRAGVEGHQHADQGPRAGPARRGLLQRPGPRGHRPAVRRRAPAAGRLLGHAQQGRRELAAERRDVVPAVGTARRRASSSTSSSTTKATARRSMRRSARCRARPPC